ncbi:organic cation transporter protein-like isoform X2 [Asterias rubens]|uniref:organic cation transporter protein-like isoform X2 n=1 Tax=Asterias rubens TaxID=7604 RepID=UPI001454F05C|nr:organic cation transporter protein-like isoform X2 [Asterias rubens]
MHFDEALKYLGDFGRYQKVVYFTLCLLAIPCAWHSLGNTFLSASPDHHCSLYDGYTYNTSQEALMSCAVPRKDDGSWDSCRRYNISIGPGGVECSPDEPRDTIPCDEWVYDSTSYTKTAVSEWDLVCENKVKRQLSKTLVLIGKMTGSLIFGQFADFAGRKKSFTLAILLMVAAGTGASFVTHFALFCFMQLLLGVSASGTFVVAIVIATEMVGKSQRANAGLIIEYFYTIGYMSMALIAWKLRDWHTIELAISIPPIIFLAYYFIVPESPRWLLSKGKTAEVEKIVRKAAKINKVKIPESVFRDYSSQTGEKIIGKETKTVKTYTFFDLMRYPNMRKKTLVIYFIWLSNNLVYYGLSFFSEDLGTDPYLAFFLAGAVEIPAYIVCQLLLDRTGRKWLICIFMTTGGVSLLFAMAIPTDSTTLILVIAMIGKLCISGSYAIVYLFTIELFPTPVRNVGVGMGSFVSRIGSIASPYVLYLGDVTFFQLPFLVFGSFALLAGVSTLLLPDTLGAKLPQTMEEGEAFGKNMTFRQMVAFPGCGKKFEQIKDEDDRDEKEDPAGSEMKMLNM